MHPDPMTILAGKSRVKLHLGDCQASMPKVLADGTVDVVVTSPPYNIGVKYSKYEDTMTREAYLHWLGQVADEIRRVLQDDGSFFLNIGSTPRDPWIPFEVAQAMRSRFTLQNTIHWVKSISIEHKDAGGYDILRGDLTVGHFKPVNSRRFVNDCHEYLFHFTKTGGVELDRLAVGVPYQDKTNIARWASVKKDKRCRGNVWFVPYKTIQSRRMERPHPATFPVELARKAILLHGARRGLLVCDPFLGIGHAALAAVEAGADFVGFEIDEEYLAVAVENVKNAADPGSEDMLSGLEEPDG